MPILPSGRARRGLRLPLAMVALAAAGAAPLAAQGRLLRQSSASAGVLADQVTFGSGGLLQREVDTGDSLRIRKVSQLAVPFGVRVPLGNVLTLDGTWFWTTGSVEYDLVRGGQPAAGKSTLSGISDARLRATLRLFGDQLLVTAGVNAPAGQTQLSNQELRGVRIFAAPSVGVHAPGIGQGAGGTGGLVFARNLGGWGIALGTSYEIRGAYAPIAAAAANLPALDLQPGNAIRGSLALERLVGESRLTLNITGDVFQEDRLRNPSATPGQDLLARVKLGPVITTDLQFQLAPRGLRELTFYAANRYRMAFERNDTTVTGSSGNYLNAGVKVVKRAGETADIFAALDVRYHTGLDFAASLAAAKATGATLNVGYAFRTGGIAIQPFVQGQFNSIDTKIDSKTAIGYGGGLFIVSRF